MGFPQIDQYVHESMHTIDNGILRLGFYQVLRVGFHSEKEKWKYIRPHYPAATQKRYTAMVNDAFDVYRKCQPNDYVRQPRNPCDAAHDYKTAEVRLAATRFLPAFLQLPRAQEFLDTELAGNYMNLVVFCRLVNHFSTKPLSEVRVFFFSTFVFVCIHNSCFACVHCKTQTAFADLPCFVYSLTGGFAAGTGTSAEIPRVFCSARALSHVPAACSFCNSRHRRCGPFWVWCRTPERVPI